MSEIPEDILAKARDLLAGGWPPEGGSRSWLRYRDIIARALMEERERCARIAAEHGTPNRFSVPDVWRNEQSPSEVYGTAAQDVSLWIEAAIRAGGGQNE